MTSFIKQLLELFAETEIFIFIFMEIGIKVSLIQRVMLHKAKNLDILIFIIVFGFFSILGTYVGIPLSNGAIVNIRDFSPIIAGLTAGPWVGLAVGLIGGVHRMFLGGITHISCGLATVLAGLIAGGFYSLNKGRLLKIWQGMFVPILVEIVHGGVTLLIARPYDQALEIVKEAIPAMIVANTLGIIIALIICENLFRERRVRIVAETDQSET